MKKRIYTEQIFNLLKFAGVTIAFFVGSGFATAQEILQYFAAYGWQFLIVVLVSMSIFIYTNWDFIGVGASLRPCNGNELYSFYCGRKLGAFYDIFSGIFVYLSYIVMCGGIGSAVFQQFSIPPLVGMAGLALLTGLTVTLGIKGLVSVIGKVGPVIILSILIIGIATVVRDFQAISSGIQQIHSGDIVVIKVGSNPVSAAFSYAGFVLLWFCSFMAELGKKHECTIVRKGMCLGSGAIALTLVVISLALIANINAVGSSDIPSIVLATKISPAFASFFAVIIIAGSYTASVPLLWTAVTHFTSEGAKHFRMVVIVLAFLGAAIAWFLPYKKLVNIVYGINGYVGGIFFLFVVIRRLRLRIVPMTSFQKNFSKKRRNL